MSQHAVAQYRNIDIGEIEQEIRDKISAEMASFVRPLLSAGRINGDGTKIIERIEQETINVIREHWVG